MHLFGFIIRICPACLLVTWCTIFSHCWIMASPVSGRDSDTNISGDPLQYSTKSCDPKVRVTMLMRCRVEENWNWWTSPISVSNCRGKNIYIYIKPCAHSVYPRLAQIWQYANYTTREDRSLKMYINETALIKYTNTLSDIGFVSTINKGKCQFRSQQ